MIIGKDYIFILVPRTGSHSLEAAILKNDPDAVITDSGYRPFKWEPYDYSQEYNVPVYAVLRNPTDWILSMYSAQVNFKGNRFAPYKPALSATEILTKNDILELWCFLSKWYLKDRCYQQTHWIGKSEVILFDDINDYFDFEFPKLNSAPRTVTRLDSDAMSLAREIWKDDFALYEKLKGLK